MNKLEIVILFSFVPSMYGERLRRQTLPSHHVQVHSNHSNVLFDKFITVVSSESRIDLTERSINGSIWSNHSVVVFDSFDTFVNCSAQEAESYLTVQNAASIYAHGDDSNFYMRTNRTQRGYSSIVHDLVGNTNVSVENTGFRVQGIRGDRTGIEINTSVLSRGNYMKLAASTLSDATRQLVLLATSPLFDIRVCFIGATVYVEFGNKLIEIEKYYGVVNVYTEKYTTTAKINDTFYEIILSNDEVLIRCPTESTMIRVIGEGVNINAENFANLQVDRGGGQMSLGGDVVASEVIKITALSIDLNFSNSGRVTGTSTNSHIAVQTAVQNVAMTSARHNIRIEGGTPQLTLESGRICVDVRTNQGLPNIDGLLPIFEIPVDKFTDVGPVQVVPRPSTMTPEIAEPSFPRPGEVADIPLSMFGLNDTRCQTCANHTTSTTVTRDHDGFPTPDGLSFSNDTTSGQFPTPSALPLSSEGGGGSWGSDTETLFPTPPPRIQSKPSILVLRMKVPSELDLGSFDLAGNLTSALSNVVRESVRRVKRTKRSPSIQLVKVHRIEPVGNEMSVLFSVNESEVDSHVVEEDLYSLDLSYLEHFLGFHVLSTISRADMNTFLNFMAIGLLAFALSITFFCIVFRSTLREMVKTCSSKTTICPWQFRRQERVNSITIITDDILLS
ncbi:hypothetical protein Q1695_000541 [Nippostrongylus brasiliensis]|nr:hypothetical protein Q1695_000541 [Nippostrongylus brasiliensis]